MSATLAVGLESASAEARWRPVPWPQMSCIYHVVIDRFATGPRRFDRSPDARYHERLGQWMGGTLQGTAGSLDYLERLGVDTILLTPFFRGEKYHGYWVTDHWAVDPHLGSAGDLLRLVEEVHGRGMRILMDLPVTHCHVSCPMAADVRRRGRRSPYRDWFLRDGSGRFVGYFGDPLLPELNLENPGVRGHVKRLIAHWLAFGFDGVRFDHAKRPSPGFWAEIRSHLARVAPAAFLFGENWQESGRVGSLRSFLHGELNVPLAEALRGFLARPGPGAAAAIAEVVREQEPLRREGYVLPSYLDSHDLERAAQLARSDLGLLRLAYALQFVLPYPPIVYYGSERGQRQTRVCEAGTYERDRYFREPMRWDEGGELANWVGALAAVRRTIGAALRSGECELDPSTPGLLRWGCARDGEEIAALLNYGDRPVQIRLTGRRAATLLATPGVAAPTDASGPNLTLGRRQGIILRLAPARRRR